MTTIGIRVGRPGLRGLAAPKRIARRRA